jgi:hypothetical protein
MFFVGRYVIPVSYLIFDSFTDSDNTLLNFHSGETSSTWAFGLNQNAADTARIFSNVLVKEDSGLSNAAVYYTETTPNNDCYVQGKIKMLSSISANVALIGRLNPASDDYYWVRHNRDANQWQLRKTVGSSASTLNSGAAVYNDTMVANDERIVRLEMNGTTIRVIIDGTERINATDSTHSSGRAGIRFAGIASPTTGYSIDDFTVGNL